MDLFRAWRVGAEARSSAEVTFTDTQQLFLRENTVVVIYGPERRRARLDAPEAVLERGTLRSRLGELSGPKVKVVTPSSEAELGRGSAVVSVDGAGLSTVANHEGAAVGLRGKAGGKVAVKSGMGTRVAVGQKPEKPRPLPPAPAWQTPGPLGFVAVGDGASIAASWTPEPKAASYRFELMRGAALVAAGEVPATVTRFEVHGAPPGTYSARLASFDKDRLESKPGPALAITVRAIAFAAPGTTAATVAPAAADDEPIALVAAPGPVVLARGTRVETSGFNCVVGTGSDPVTILGEVGATELRCDDGGLAFAPVAVNVTAIEVALDTTTRTLAQGGSTTVAIALASPVALGDAWQLETSPGLTATVVRASSTGIEIQVSAAADAPRGGFLRVVDAATQRAIGEVAIEVEPTAGPEPVRPPPPEPVTIATRPQWTVGLAVGAAHLSTDGANGNELGNAALPIDTVGSGAAVTARTAWWFGRDLFAEADLAVIPAAFVGGDRAMVYGAHAHLGVRLIDRGRYAVRTLVGGGAFALRSDSAYADDDIDPNLDWGLTGAVQLSRWATVRLDGRQHIVADRSGGVTNTLELNLGLEFVLSRAP